MESFILNLPVKILFGSGTINCLVDEILERGSRVLFVTGEYSFLASGRKEKLLEELGEEVECFWQHGVEINPTVEAVNQLAEKLREQQPDLIVAIGGGSVMDTAKALAILLFTKESHSILDYISEWEENTIPVEGRLPLILVPTVAATGSEANCGLVLNHHQPKAKITFFHPQVYADLSIIDPELTVDLPKEQKLRGLFDAFCHILESTLTGSGEAIVTRRTNTVMLQRLMEISQEILEDELTTSANQELSWIAALGLSGLPDAGLDGVYPLHDLAAILAGRLSLVHADSLAALLLPMVHYSRTAREVEERMAELAKQLFGGTNGDDFEAGLERWLNSLQLIPQIKKGLEEEEMESMAFDAITLFGGGGMSVANPVPLRIDDMVTLYKEANVLLLRSK